MAKCAYAGNEILGVECSGDEWESPHYFTNGASLYACDAHARAMILANPFGPRFRPVTPPKASREEVVAKGSSLNGGDS